MARPMPKHPQLRGNFAPLGMECDAHDLIVHGEIPAELNGTYYRNGPDPQYAPRGAHHWFAGDGMIHAFHIEGGRCRYRYPLNTEKFSSKPLKRATIAVTIKADQPIKVIYGRSDPISGVAMCRRFQELDASVDSLALRRVGHYPHYEAPVEVFEAYQAFREQRD